MTFNSSDNHLGEWQNSFCIGNETLDNQHKTLLKICVKLRECLNEEPINGDLRFHEILNDLSFYAKLHFRTEETILRLKISPFISSHIAEHNEYFVWLEALMFEATQGRIDKESLLRRIIEWWVEHICMSGETCRSSLAD